MSSDEEEFFDASPEVVLPRLGNRRKANKTSPRKVPKKKQRDALSDFNLPLDNGVDDDDVGEEIVERPKNIRRGAAKSITAENTSAMETPVGTRVGAENRPPATSLEVPDDDDDGHGQSHSGDGSSSTKARSRKRLSIRSVDSGVSSGRRSSTTSSGVESLATPSEVQNIYQTCSQMYNANRINPQNAFNLRLLDCINQMINSPSYDKSNMQLTSSTVEIGTKIYICRVDNTHSQVLSLASDISLQQRRKKKDGTAAEGGNGNEDEDQEMMNGDDGMYEDDERGNRQKQKRRNVRKRGRFVEEDNSKLLTGLEEQNVKFVTRRNFLQKKFNEMIYGDLDFDYLSYFLETEDQHPLQTESERNKLKNPMAIADSHMISGNEMSRLDFLPFVQMANFEPDTYDIWGRPLNSTENFRDQGFDDPELPVNAEFAYNPADRPAEYPEEIGPDNFMNETMGDNFGEGDEPVGLPPVSFHDIRTLDNLDEYFQRVRNLLKDSKSKYGWCGPNFVRPKSTWPVARLGVKKAKIRKEPKPVDFTTLKWADKSNKYNVNSQSARTIYDDRVIESWNQQKVIIPFVGIELTSYDDEFDPLDFENENDPRYVPAIFKLFTSKNRSIMDLLKTRERLRHLSGSSGGAPNLGDDGFDQDHDIELPRGLAEDFCSQPMNEDEFQADTQIPTDAGWQFQTPTPGLLSDDPLSLTDVESIRFSRKPKPINMSLLKSSILKTLIEKLDLDDTGKPLNEEETKIDLAELMFLVLRKIGEKTEKLMSVPIFIVALMHVVADKSLFVEYDDSDPECPVIVCKGKNFDHGKHIPMPIGGFDDE